jgi:8-oxo-dGTP diphosphatase
MVVTDLVRAAGGIPFRLAEDGDQVVAVIHRPRYDDWSFPKGKLHPGEDEMEAALREVEEETGFRCEVGPEIGTVSYTDRRGRPKRVRYWLMRPTEGTFAAGDEVDELRWVARDRAGRLLSYDHDRQLLGRLDDIPWPAEP